jgi:catechol 2,3-dioxygenase-like lactoylglutathione lyase family enzyme
VKEENMIKSFDHFSFTVSNLEEAVNFFCNLLGLQIFVPSDIKAEGPFLTPKGKDLEELLQIPEVSLRECFLKTPDNIIMELIEYVNPKGKSIDLKTCNFGVAHVSFIVNDLEGMYRDLTKKGVLFNNRPQLNPSIGRCVCYIKGPDGITVELAEIKDKV